MNKHSPNSNSSSLQPLLKESTHRFLTEHQNGATDFSNFTSIFSRLLHSLPDPPLEIVWFYSALNFHSTKSTDTSRQVLPVKDLFQLLVSCSSSCNAVKKIAILAPVIHELFSEVSGKKDLREETESLIEGIICYVSINCANNFDEHEESGDLVSCYRELVRVWMVDKIGGDCKFGEDVRLFCPVVSDGVREGMVSEGFGVGYLAGVVTCEAFLLRLCLKFGCGVSRVELEKELLDCAVQMIGAFRSYYFVDILLRMLLEPVLPVNAILNPKDEVILREVLYDVVITMAHSFSIPQKGIEPPGVQLKNLALTWLFVSDNAIRFVRENGNMTKVISYLQAFSESCLLSHLIKWVMSQPGVQSKTNAPNVFTPVAVIKWLLIVEDEGSREFDSGISKIYAKASICKSRTECEILVDKSGGKNLNENHFFYPGKELKEDDKVDGDLEMVDSADTMFLGAPGLMKLTETGGIRKRKEGRNEEGDKRVKFFKCQLGDELTREEKVWPLCDGGGFCNGSEVYNPLSVENVVSMEQ
ncbi:hypothetical protein OIU85_017416 [Salix viminalis]|uniref:Uncharacterized protein n=1 Tax=Salix viminalis TaxID=40686 RepID=A0A9Q0V825_SALVM|nr:hypothetical protein OIU85_017416 [Salix viminalis]